MLKIEEKIIKNDDASRGFPSRDGVLVSAVLLVAQAKGVTEVEAQETFFSLSDDAAAAFSAAAKLGINLNVPLYFATSNQ